VATQLLTAYGIPARNLDGGWTTWRNTPGATVTVAAPKTTPRSATEATARSATEATAKAAPKAVARAAAR
jgi:3-mercaptopyruvate sulfurtransferase SseA